jgi:hypothetical protein
MIIFFVNLLITLLTLGNESETVTKEIKSKINYIKIYLKLFYFTSCDLKFLLYVSCFICVVVTVEEYRKEKYPSKFLFSTNKVLPKPCIFF